MPNY
ncbi:hypothetical protein YPPY12_1671, partial [Yersinia pestis PY-12]|jgi:hypothetical protein